MMNKEKKKIYIDEMKDFFSKNNSIFVTHYQGLTVKQIDELRAEMRKHGILFKITKNRITKLALEKSKFKKYSDNKYNFSLEYPAEIDSHFKGVDSIPMIWKNSPNPELPEFKVWKTVKTIPEGLFATTFEFKVFSDNGMSEYSQSELVDLLENYSINLFTVFPFFC